jgi:histidine ammonia-lyase
LKFHYIKNESLKINDLIKIIDNNLSLCLSEDAKHKVVECRNYLDIKALESDVPIYGVNTGFGSLCDQRIPNEDLEELQKRLVMSHACGLGDEVPSDIVKMMILLKIQSLSYGHSGIQLQTIERLIEFYNNDIIPVVYQQGSLGASGDLAPLAHLSLPLLGMGEVYYKDQKMDSKKLLSIMNWDPITLKSKEGLALLNGTQMMSAYALWCLIKSFKYCYLSDMIAAVSIDAFDGRIEPFHPKVHELRPHKGQILTAQFIREFLSDSEIIKSKKVHVQDPYSFRCIPQVHGASKDAILYAHQVIMTEINSVTDNPNIFSDEDLIISAGNFHGQPLALAMDHMAIAIAELGSISERRTFQLISGQRELPAYLVSNPGLNSGFMIPQYTAASIVSQNKQLCTPSSVDSIVSSNGQEDHVSMGANGATKLFKVVENLEKVLAIELMTASQALSFRSLKSSTFLNEMLDQFRESVPVQENDSVMHLMMNDSISFIQHLTIDEDLMLFNIYDR